MDFLPSARMADVMAAASAGIVPKRADGLGNEAFSTKILEFMACAVPVIVSRTRIDEFYFDDSLVTFFDPANADSLAEAMRGVFHHPEQQRREVRAATAFLEAHSWQARRSDYYGLIDALLSSSARG